MHKIKIKAITIIAAATIQIHHNVLTNEAAEAKLPDSNVVIIDIIPLAKNWAKIGGIDKIDTTVSVFLLASASLNIKLNRAIPDAPTPAPTD